MVAKKTSQRRGFSTGEYVVYPAHGVGKIVAIDKQDIAGYSLELFVVAFEKEKMTLRVPVSKVEAVGMRKLSSSSVTEKVKIVLSSRARAKRSMWSRRAQEYSAKINSGDLISVAEVIRDLARHETRPEQSYSERQLYELALERLVHEMRLIEGCSDKEVLQIIADNLAKKTKRKLQKSDKASEEAAA